MQEPIKANKHWIQQMADADLNELLLLQDKNIFDQETKYLALEVYYATVDEETLTSIIWEKQQQRRKETPPFCYE